MIESPLCMFCQKEDESLEHLLFHCNINKTFWLALSSWTSLLSPHFSWIVTGMTKAPNLAQSSVLM